ncbi:hypothetical protein GJT82_02325 [Enterobacteriaceae endosymbiont of Plateumaris rustica]|nr:hypothetical protein GJT82_02325 [Enterobacteriaceae endosymbiont of Plateumaris rustica]
METLKREGLKNQIYVNIKFINSELMNIKGINILNKFNKIFIFDSFNSRGIKEKLKTVE